jgi:hypothetical protein
MKKWFQGKVEKTLLKGGDKCFSIGDLEVLPTEIILQIIEYLLNPNSGRDFYHLQKVCKKFRHLWYY